MCRNHADRLLQDARYKFGEPELRLQRCGHRRFALHPGIEKAYGSYRDKLEYQARQMERTSSLELIRNPVDLENSSQIDDQITRELLGSLEQPPRLKLVSSGIPTFSPLPIGPDSDIRS
jgi:hypothetical protein